MFTLFPFIALFLCLVGLSLVIALSVNSLLLVWAALEINQLAILPLLTASGRAQSATSSVLYFIAQTLASSLLLLSFVAPSGAPLSIIAFALKAGLPPFHSWYPSVLAHTPWFVFWILSTVQKVVPMSLLILDPAFYNFALLFILFSALFGSLGALNQPQLRPLLAYTSMVQLAWALLGALTSLFLFSLHLLVHMAHGTLASYMMYRTQTSATGRTPPSSFFPLSPSLVFFSWAGLPPLLGFTPKLMIILSSPPLPPLGPLLVGSLITLVVYLRISFCFFQTTPSTNNYRAFFPSMLTLFVPSGALLLFFLYALTFFY